MNSTVIWQRGLLLAAVGQLGFALHSPAEDWKDKTIAPVANPVFFEDPHIRNEIRPVFMDHFIDKNFVTGGGDVRLFAAELRWAATERLGIIATKDGYIQFNPKVGADHEGWADIGAGLKYALIDRREDQFILTPGLTFEVPTGNERLFQGNGKGEWNLFISAAKGWDNLHLTGNVGARVPNDFSKETASAHYSLQLDYYVSRWFQPFVVANGFTVLSDSKVIPIKTEGYDLINFGATDARGRTMAAVGAGFRTRLTKSLEAGFAYEAGVISPKGLFDDRYTVDLILHF